MQTKGTKSNKLKKENEKSQINMPPFSMMHATRKIKGKKNDYKTGI